MSSIQGGIAILSIPEDKCYLPTLTNKSQPSIRQKDSNPPKRNTVLHQVSLNGKYSKAGLAL
ncbi:MAG: hypothetical protein HWD63_03860 [Candidatus Parvibacillus calidus]|nr:MAG: hypothetical protein HWD63_03860 [Candidatus Parvibacillus calidus]